MELNSPNDVVVKSDGAIYFTDPTTEGLEKTSGATPLTLVSEAFFG